MGENTQYDISRAAELLNHDSVIECLTKLALVDLKLSKYFTAEDNISKKYYSSLKAVASKSLDVIFMFLRSLMPLFHKKGNGKGMRVRKKVMLKKKCQFDVGELYKPHSCEDVG